MAGLPDRIGSAVVLSIAAPQHVENQATLARSSTRFVCQACGASYPKWSGKCDACGEWNSLVEEAVPESAPKGLGRSAGRRIDFVDLKGVSEKAPRRITG